VSEKRGQIAFYGTEDYRYWLKEKAHERRIKVQQLLERAVADYVSGRDADGPTKEPPKGQPFDPSDLTVTARTPDQKRILSAVLMLLNDPDVCPVHRPILEVLLAPELENLGAEPDNREPNGEEGVA
jgi:hypothetical protein